MKNLLKRFVDEESGATMVEYAIMVALIAVVAIVVVGLVGDQVTAAFQSVETGLSGAVGGETTE
jgi:pilus assembly protein Flp/PilA